jgi:hypothetical protein
LVSPAPRLRLFESSEEEVEEIELADLPAAVVCATCGESDCPGCALEPARDTRSGLVVFVPWERPQLGLWGRFWTTSRLTTESAETFFASIPDGSVSPALSYALLAESVAVGSTVLAWTALGVGLMYAILPAFTAHTLSSASGQAGLIRMSGVAWIAFTSVLLLTHLIHGYFLDREAGRAGRERKPARALRFGLYAAGWDVAQSPIGFAALLIRRGPGAFREALRHATTTPGRATTALLRGVYGLEGEALATVRRRSFLRTMIASVLVICAGVAAVTASMFVS